MTAASDTEIVRFQPKTIDELYLSYMSNLINGGLFVATAKPHALGDAIFIILTLPGDQTRYTAEGKVVWLNPKTANPKDQGVGVMFNNDPKYVQLKLQIERLLGKRLFDQQRSNTL